MKERDLWIDFNDVGDESRACGLMKFATPGVDMVVGAHIVVGDDEGNLCEAQVVGLHDGFVELAIDGNTFSRHDHAGEPSLLGT
jgi:hypothetical protein